ncbi:hypothetical protein O181_055011, partial [Austropuccinia psidii MF-1]|nr:hypothetical protein [Austropuccinia psidii MF-1]
KIAIIGAGLTGISSAAHFLAHGFDVVIFEKFNSIGGIWNHVNNTSTLQLDSIMYRFHPSVIWSRRFPVGKNEILSEIQKIFLDYQLDQKTHFNFHVKKIWRQWDHLNQKSNWFINDLKFGSFDAIIVAIGACGSINQIDFLGRNSFKGQIVHSSKLDLINFNQKRVVTIGGGASAVEAIELAIQSNCAPNPVLITRTDKWFIPRNPTICSLLTSNSLGRPCFLDGLVHYLLKTFHYGHKLHWMIPKDKNGLISPFYHQTPIANSKLLKLIRIGKVNYTQAQVIRILPNGIQIKKLSSNQSQIINADILIEATGFKRPKLDFLPSHELFSGPKGLKQYSPPNLFLQTFTVNDWRCAMINVAYVEALGSVGNWHIGTLTRMMIMFLLDSSAAPSQNEMMVWVDQTIKQKGSLNYFTYSEYYKWFIFFFLSNINRWSWFIFVFFGWGGIPTRKSSQNHFKNTYPIHQ